MEKKVQYGIISFCPDLTDPDAESVDVAVVGTVWDREIVKGSDSRETFLIAVSNIDEIPVIANDPIALGLIQDLPDFLSKQVKKGIKTVGSDELLGWVHHSLRNSLYLSEVRSLDRSSVGDLSYIAEIVAKDVWGDKVSSLTPPYANDDLSKSNLTPEATLTLQEKISVTALS